MIPLASACRPPRGPKVGSSCLGMSSCADLTSSSSPGPKCGNWWGPNARLQLPLSRKPCRLLHNWPGFFRWCPLNRSAALHCCINCLARGWGRGVVRDHEGRSNCPPSPPPKPCCCQLKVGRLLWGFKVMKETKRRRRWFVIANAMLRSKIAFTTCKKGFLLFCHCFQ